MRIIQRRVAVKPGIDITSVWAIPDHFAPGQTDAIILAHGAGNDMNHPFMSYFHEALAAAGLLSIKFNFPYTEQGRKAPDRPAMLEQTWVAIANAVANDGNWRPRRLFLAGKSMGGRMASMAVAQGLPCDGLIFLGYPLHPPKQPDKIRTEHWPAIHCPTLFLEGTRDTLCDLNLLNASLPKLGGHVNLTVIEGGDHSFKVPKSLGQDQDGVYADMVQSILGWVNQLPPVQL
jgi:predicted alpha/beta-hydrolase family hydrolase